MTGVPTSFAAERLARQHGVPVVTIDDLGLEALPTSQPPLDLALDGADEVGPEADLIKGRGAAHVREKVVASLAARFAVLVDASKEVARLGTSMPVPVEVLPFAQAAVARALRGLGAEPDAPDGRAEGRARRDRPGVLGPGRPFPRHRATPAVWPRRSTRSPASWATACSSGWRPTCWSAATTGRSATRSSSGSGGRAATSAGRWAAPRSTLSPRSVIRVPSSRRRWATLPAEPPSCAVAEAGGVSTPTVCLHNGDSPAWAGTTRQSEEPGRCGAAGLSPLSGSDSPHAVPEAAGPHTKPPRRPKPAGRCLSQPSARSSGGGR